MHRTPDGKEVRVPAGARWDCRSCGACCRGYEFGPVEPGVIAGLEARDIGARWAPAAERPWYERRVDEAGREAFYLAKIDDHCIFLRDDNLCAVHAAFGEAAKPAFCREFPFHLVEDPVGLVAIVRSDCKGFHHAFVDGAPIESHVDAIAALPRAIPLRRWAPPTVSVLPGVVVALETWMTWEDAVLAELAESADPELAIGRVRDRLVALSGAAPPAADAARGRFAMKAVLTALGMVMQKVLSTDQSGGSPHQVAFARHMAERVALGLGRVDAPLPPLAPDARDWLNLVLRSFLLAKQHAAAGGVAEGLGGWLLGVTFARLVAGDGAAAAISAELTAWNRFAANRTIDWTLGKAKPALVDVFLYGV